MKSLFSRVGAVDTLWGVSERAVHEIFQTSHTFMTESRLTHTEEITDAFRHSSTT